MLMKLKNQKRLKNILQGNRIETPEYIKDNNLPVKLVMTVHDQIDTVCLSTYADKWKIKMTELMEEAAKYIITNGLLKADTHISETWKK